MPFQNLSALARTWADARPEHVALRCGPESLTYAELASRAAQVSQALAAEGLGRGSRVAYYGRASVTFFETLFGAAGVGATLVPLNWRLAPPEIATVLGDAQTELVVVHEEFTAVIEAARSELPDLRTVVSIGDSPGLADFAGWRDRHPGQPIGPGHRSDDVALQIYTSGTTGRPKGVMNASAGLTFYLDSLSDVARIAEGSVSLCTLPLFHIGGIGWVLAGLNRGCTTEILREVDGDGIIRAVEKAHATVLIAVPSVIRTILDAPALPRANLDTLQTLYYGGGPVTQQVLDDALDALKCDFVQGFGLTECPLATALSPAEHAVELLQSCGRAIPGTEVRIVDPDTGADVPIGTVGELWIRSPMAMAGYWRQPAATAATLIEDGWLRTGDAARLDAAGYVFMADRIKDMIVTGGENVYPAEVENVLAGHPALEACAVIGVASRRWTEAVAAVVVRRPGHDVTAEELIEYCRSRLAGYKRPKSITFVSELPRTPAGKVMKYLLREQHPGTGE